jgi:hypothetical protein
MIHSPASGSAKRIIQRRGINPTTPLPESRINLTDPISLTNPNHQCRNTGVAGFFNSSSRFQPTFQPLPTLSNGVFALPPYTPGPLEGTAPVGPGRPSQRSDRTENRAATELATNGYAACPSPSIQPTTAEVLQPTLPGPSLRGRGNWSASIMR